MSGARVRIYVAAMWVAAAVALTAADWESLLALPRESVIALGALVAIALFSELLAIGVSVARGGSYSVAFVPLLASVQLFGPAGGVLLFAITVPFAEFVVRRKDLLRGSFNCAQTIVAATLAGHAFVVLGGQALEGAPDLNMTTQLWPFISFGLVFLGINHAAVSLAITLSQGLPFRRVWDQLLANTGASLNDVLISPIALAVAFLYVQFGLAGIMIVLLPMLFIRYSYLTTSRLRQSNADLLTALVKAIEIRDPYTSGHSLRVSGLAARIAEEMGLNRVAIDRIANAALVHDIGKIEEIYTDILRKPDALTDDERAIMESHVTRGVQLLKDLSSVPDEVVRIVQHHHEREDGKGYPAGLLGDEIPLGSKIIVLCDAVDAMLSDRPYRAALPLESVVDQLHKHAGQQFDHRVVRAATRSKILAEYAESIRRARAEAGRVEAPNVGKPDLRVVDGSRAPEVSVAYH